MGYFRKMFLNHSVFSHQRTASCDTTSGAHTPAGKSSPPSLPSLPPPFFSHPQIVESPVSNPGSPPYKWNESKLQVTDYFNYKKPAGDLLSGYPARPYFSCSSAFCSSSSLSSVSSLASASSTRSLPGSPKVATPSALKKPSTPAEAVIKSKCRVSFSNPEKHTPVFMNPLFASSSTHRAPIHYDAGVTPLGTTIMDFTQTRIPVSTLLEPATEPPIRGKLLLSSDTLPWSIVVHASGNATPVDNTFTGKPVSPASSPHSSPARPKHKFYIDDDDEEDDDDDESSDNSVGDKDGRHDGCASAVVSNLDILCAVHTSLATPVTQSEWKALGDESDEQRKVADAYRQRCQDVKGDLNRGVKRIDFLKSKTILVGIEAGRKAPIDGQYGTGSPVGRLVFAGE